jgi:hypothetical protein
MARFPAECEVLHNCCSVLVLLCYEHAPACMRASAAGAVEAVIAALAANRSNDALHKTGVRALGVIGAGDRSKAPAALDAVMASMAAHRGSAVVATCGCQVLHNLLHCPETKPAASAARAAIMEAMRSHPGDTDVQINACGALDVLLRDVDSTLQTECGVAGAPQLLIAALNTCTDRAVQQNSCAALEALVHGHKANKLLAVRAGGIEALLAAIQPPYPADTSPSERQVPSCGLAALAALVDELLESAASANGSAHHAPVRRRCICAAGRLRRAVLHLP